MRRASADDIPLLVGLMTEFYAEAGYELDRERAAGAFAAVLADERLGYTWIIQEKHHDVGHVVLTLKYAMEYGGLVACLDDLYVKPGWRNKGLSTAALIEVRRFCETAGIRAVTVEVGHNNGPAQTVYRRVGFAEPPDRQLLILALADPAHIV
jgi:GNAT superfamily N-acetyltransferase